MPERKVSVSIKMTQKQAGRMYMQNIELKEEIAMLKANLQHADDKIEELQKHIREEKQVFNYKTRGIKTHIP